MESNPLRDCLFINASDMQQFTMQTIVLDKLFATMAEFVKRCRMLKTQIGSQKDCVCTLHIFKSNDPQEEVLVIWDSSTKKEKIMLVNGHGNVGMDFKMSSYGTLESA